MVSCVLAILSASGNFSYLAILSASYKLGKILLSNAFNILAQIPDVVNSRRERQREFQRKRGSRR